MNRYELLKTLTLEELAEDLVGDIAEFLLEIISVPFSAELCKEWLSEEVTDI